MQCWCNISLERDEFPGIPDVAREADVIRAEPSQDGQ